MVLLAYPAIAMALNAVWNMHYLLAAAKRAGGQSQSTTAVGMVLVVALSFLVFYPAGWTAVRVARHFTDVSSFSWVAGSGVAVQYAVDVLLVLLLARLFERFEVTRDAH